VIEDENRGQSEKSLILKWVDDIKLPNIQVNANEHYYTVSAIQKITTLQNWAKHTKCTKRKNQSWAVT